MSEQVTDTRKHIINTFERYIGHLIKKIDRREGKLTVNLNEVIVRLKFTRTTFHDYGGYTLIEYELPFVNYLTNTGKIEIDIEKAREYYGID